MSLTPAQKRRIKLIEKEIIWWAGVFPKLNGNGIPPKPNTAPGKKAKKVIIDFIADEDYHKVMSYVGNLSREKCELEEKGYLKEMNTKNATTK